jgi:peroxiredoxin (alkyl hydroperoxide reductase subunit C)
MATAVGKKFPNLNVDAMNEMGDTFKLNVLEEAIKNKKKVLLFWYPKDFTFVCPTELHAFQAALDEFEKRNTVVIGASCDTPEVHFAWLSTSKDNGGIEGVTYPILGRQQQKFIKYFGNLDITNEVYDDATDTVQVEGDNVTYRATYLIDEKELYFMKVLTTCQ